MKEKPKKEPKPRLIKVFVRELSTNTIICEFPPTRAGERRAERFRGLTDLQIVKYYEKGGHNYESY